MMRKRMLFSEFYSVSRKSWYQDGWNVRSDLGPFSLDFRSPGDVSLARLLGWTHCVLNGVSLYKVLYANLYG